MRRVNFGPNKAIAALTFDEKTMELGAIFHVPTRQDEQGKTWYRALACSISITREQLDALQELFIKKETT